MQTLYSDHNWWCCSYVRCEETGEASVQLHCSDSDGHSICSKQETHSLRDIPVSTGKIQKNIDVRKVWDIFHCFSKSSRSSVAPIKAGRTLFVTISLSTSVSSSCPRLWVDLARVTTGQLTLLRNTCLRHRHRYIFCHLIPISTNLMIANYTFSSLQANAPPFFCYTNNCAFACKKWKKLDWNIFLNLAEYLPMNLRREASEGDLVASGTRILVNTTEEVSTSHPPMRVQSSVPNQSQLVSTTRPQALVRRRATCQLMCPHHLTPVPWSVLRWSTLVTLTHLSCLNLTHHLYHSTTIIPSSPLYQVRQWGNHWKYFIQK